jgi:hypothetical protein
MYKWDLETRASNANGFTLSRLSYTRYGGIELYLYQQLEMPIIDLQ